MKYSNEANKKRSEYVNKVKEFARSEKGWGIISQLAPEIAEMIEENPEYLDIPQNNNDPRLSGIYRADMYDRLFYIGESGNCVFRIAEHIYNYCHEEKYFGHKYDPSIPARFKVFRRGDVDKKEREKKEAERIDDDKPVLQWTSPDDPIYGFDKPIPEGETRDSMRPDICIWPKLRIARFKEIQNSYNNKRDL